LTLGSCAGASTSAPSPAAAPAAVAIWSCAEPTDLRFRVFPGVPGWAQAAKDSCPWPALTAGWRLGSSAVAANGGFCCELAAMGEGFRLRLATGEEL
jgi:hypothetical protein